MRPYPAPRPVPRLGEGPAPGGPPRGGRPPPLAIPSRAHDGGAPQDLGLPGVAAPQSVPAAAACRPQGHAHPTSAPRGASDGWRFPSALPCRDAKQSGGCADGMTVSPTGGTQAAQLALCRVHGASRRRTEGHPCAPAYRVLDLQANCRGSTSVEETINMLPEKPAPVF